MLSSIWDFLKEGSNQAVLSWIGSGIVVVLGGLWAVLKCFVTTDEKTGRRIAEAQKPLADQVARDTDITGQSTKRGPVLCDRSESLAAIIRDHALQARVEINAPLERVWHLIDDDDARQTWDRELAVFQNHYLTEPKAAGTPFVVKRREKKFMLFKMTLEGAIHVYLPPRAISLRLGLSDAFVFRTILLSRNRNMTTVDSYVGVSSEVKCVAFFYDFLLS
jgi:hypothetical protein